MSNLLLFAQTQPTTSPADAAVNSALLLLGIIWLLASAHTIRRRKLYEIPPIPALPDPARPAILLATIIAAFATFMAVLAVYASVLHIDHAALQKPEGTRLMMFAQPLAQLAGAAAALILLTSLGLLPNLFHWPQSQPKPIRYALITYLLVVPWVVIAGIIVQRIAEATGADPNAKHVLFTVWQGEPSGFTALKLTAFFSAAVAAPIAEEIVFRGLLQRMLENLTPQPFTAILLTSLAFAMVHQPWTLQPGVFVLSVFLGLAYFRTGSLLVPILAHALFNGVQMVLFMLLPS